MLGLPTALLPRTAAAADAPFAPPAPLARRVAAEVAERWGVPSASLRLEWGRASSEADLHGGEAFRLLGHGAGGWFVVVVRPGAPDALAVRMRAGVEQRAPVAARALPAGALATRADVRHELRLHWGRPDATPDEAPASGWRVRRDLAAGDVLAWPAVDAPPLVAAGEPVRIAWRRAGVQVTLTGVALNDAGEGETVRARVADRPARLVARVTGRGTAELPGGER